MKIHRAIVLVAMMLLSIGALALLLTQAGGKSLVALVVVLVAAAIGGIAFSWKRYYRR
jgi:NADH:ubiquinone oxidoreductase subunit K